MSYTVATPANVGPLWLVEINPPVPKQPGILPIPGLLMAGPMMAPDTPTEPPSPAPVLRMSDAGWIGAPGDPTLPNEPYPGRLAEAPQITRDIPIYPETDRRAQIDGGALAILNTDGAFASLDSDWRLAGSRIVILRGPNLRPNPAPYSAFQRIAELRVDNAFQGGRRLTVPLMGAATDLEVPVCRTFAGTGGQEGPATLAGQNKQRVFGIKRNLRPTLIDSAKLAYLLHDGAMQQVMAVRDKAVPLTFGTNHGSYAALDAATVAQGTYHTCLATGHMRVGALSGGETPRNLTADVRGDTSVGGYGGGTGARIAVQLLRTIAGVPSGRAQESAFSAWPTYEGGEVFRDGTVSAALDTISAGFMGWWGADLFGAFGGSLVTPPETATPGLTLDEFNLVAPPEGVEQPRPPLWRTSVAYQNLDTTQTGDAIAGSVSPADALYYGIKRRIANAPTDGSGVVVRQMFVAAQDGPVIGGTLDVEADARAVAMRAMALFGTNRQSWVVQVDDAVWPFMWPGQVVRLVWPGSGRLTQGLNLVVRQIMSRRRKAEVTLWG